MSRTAPIGYYWGDDAYGIARAAHDLGRRMGESAGTPLTRWSVNGDSTTAADIGERVATATLFGGGTLVLVSDPAPLLQSKADREALVAVLPLVAPGNALAFLEIVDGSQRASAALEGLRTAVAAAGGEVVPFRAPRQGEMAMWIERRAREDGIRLARGTAQELATRIGAFVREGDIDRRRQGEIAVGELSKLALYRPGQEIAPEDVRALVAEAIPASAWAMLDAVGSRRSQQAVELLDLLLDTMPEPVVIVLLHRRIRELIEVADLLDAGATPASLVRTLRLKPFRAERLAEQAHAWTLDELTDALDGLLGLDVLVKSADGVYASPRQRRLAFTLWVLDRVGRA